MDSEKLQETAESEVIEEKDEDWKYSEPTPLQIIEIKQKLSKNSCFKPEQTKSNVKIIFENDPNLRGMLRRNNFANKVEVHKYWWSRFSWYIEDNDYYNIELYLEKYGITSSKVIRDAMHIIAAENSYHPIQEKLNGLVWDGVSRIPHLFHIYLGVEESELTTEITRITLLELLAVFFIRALSMIK